MTYETIIISACLKRHEKCEPSCPYIVKMEFTQLPGEDLTTFQIRASEQFDIIRGVANRFYRLGLREGKEKYQPHPMLMRDKTEVLAAIKDQDDKVKDKGY